MQLQADQICEARERLHNQLRRTFLINPKSLNCHHLIDQFNQYIAAVKFEFPPEALQAQKSGYRARGLTQIDLFASRGCVVFVSLAAKFGAAVFKALKPGGVFIVTDHVALAGSGETAPKTLHRIDPAIVKAQLTAAGFLFDGESKLIANPADLHDKGVFDASLRGKTDQFAYKFRKPAK